MTLKWIHQKMSNLYCVMPLVLLIGFASFTSTPGSFSGINDYSEEDVFKSVFFAEGDLAESIPVLHQFNVRNFTKDASSLSKALQTQDQIYTAVKGKYPNYMASLQSAIASGNHLTIQKSIQKGAEYVNEMYSSLNPGLDEQTKEELVADFSKRVDIKNASPDDLKRAINDYVSSGESPNPMYKQACVAIVLLVVLALVFLFPLAAADNSISATLANETIVNALAKLGK